MVQAGPPFSPGQPGLPGFSDDFVREEPPRPGIPGLVFLLFFKPKTFFRNLGSIQGRSTLYLLALLFGLAEAIDKTEAKANLGKYAGFFDSWGAYWGAVLVGGWFGSLLIYYVGEWWFRLRLRWSGERRPDRNIARKVYLCAAQVAALPIVAKAVIGTLVYANPAAQARAENVETSAVILFFAFWSLVVSYIGVRSVFAVRKWRARLWYVILPAALNIVVIINFGVLAAIRNRVAPPDLDHPLKLSSSAMSFSYPGNWTIDQKNYPFDPEGSVWIVSPQGDVTGILLYKSALGPEAAVEFGSDNLSRIFYKSSSLPAFDTWGDWRGIGRAFEGKAEDESAVVVRLFAAWVSDKDVLEVREIIVLGRQKISGPGRDLIRSSFKLTKK